GGGEAELPAASGLQTVHEAYVVVDRVGRLQVPKEYLTALNIKDKATMEFDGERIIITPPKSLGG
ncbi:ABC transporter ATP-binding protein, partial [Paenibacillus sp. MCAF20]